MKMPIPAIVIGYRTEPKPNIGAVLASKLVKPEWELRYVVRSKRLLVPQGVGYRDSLYVASDPTAFRELLKTTPKGVIFICVQTQDTGEVALRYAEQAVSEGWYVVTAEKGMAAYHFEEVKPFIDMIDFGGTVGGGNRFMYTVADRYLSLKRVLMYGVFNATLNFILSEVNGGRSLEDAVDHASQIGIAEPLKPGEVLNPVVLINGELRDVAMKICALFNFALANGEYITPDAFGNPQINEDDISRLLSANDLWRFVVTITNQSRHIDRENDVIAPMKAEVGNWHISAGFKKIRGGPLAHWLPTVGGINNGILLTEGDHTYSFGGPGAGRATVDALLIGARRLLARTKGAYSPSDK